MLGPLLGAGLERETNGCRYRVTVTVREDRFKVTRSEPAHLCRSGQCVVDSSGVVYLGEGNSVTHLGFDTAYPEGCGFDEPLVGAFTDPKERGLETACRLRLPHRGVTSGRIMSINNGCLTGTDNGMPCNFGSSIINVGGDDDHDTGP